MNNKEKIAILIDSGCDVPNEYVEKYGMFILPLKIIYKDREYLDRVEIQPEEVYERFSTEIPKTSLPTPQLVKETIQKIVDQGYNKIISVSISSGLSGTYNVIRVTSAEFSNIDFTLIDTKNIGVGAGLSAIYAGMLIEQGLSFNEISIKLNNNVKNTKVFFCVQTLEYLIKGGRIGLVAGSIGELLNLKPIISCNDNGIYYTVDKVRGRNKSLTKTLENAVKFGKDFAEYNIAVVHGNAEEEAKEVFEKLKELFPNAKLNIFGQLCPSLIVHTGPGLIGVGIQKL